MPALQAIVGYLLSCQFFPSNGFMNLIKLQTKKGVFLISILEMNVKLSVISCRIPQLNILVTHTKIPRSTKDLVSGLRERYQQVK